MLERIDNCLLQSVYQRAVNALGASPVWLARGCMLATAALYVAKLAKHTPDSIVVMLINCVAVLVFSAVSVIPGQMIREGLAHSTIFRRLMPLVVATGAAIVVARLYVRQEAAGSVLSLLADLAGMSSLYFAACSDPPPPRRRDDTVPSPT